METLQIIIIEDIDTDAELIIRELRKSGIDFKATRIESKEELGAALQTDGVDLILSDYNLPSFNAIDALHIVKQITPEIPFILVTGAQTEEIAVNCLKEGAYDYILKNSLTRLPSAVLNAIKSLENRRERRTATKQLKDKEEKYRHLFENSLVGILRWKLEDGSIIETNKKAREFTQLFCGDLNFFHHCFLKNDEYEFLINVLQGEGEIHNFEFQVKNTGQDIRWLSLSAKVFVEEGEIEGVIQDITQSKESIVELERVNYELDRFVYHASHDLKSPLRSIMGLVYAAKEATSLEEMHGYLEMFEQCTTKLESLVSDLLTLARSNRAEENLTPFNFEKEINESLQLLTSLNKDNHISVITSIEKPTGSFVIDAVRMRIILNNLITNAHKYHRLSVQQFIKISTHYGTQDDITIIIEDNGEGISSSHLGKVFDMFYRASKTSEGSGLGLYIVKSMIEKMNGTIQVKSDVGIGTTFTVTIPIGKNRN